MRASIIVPSSEARLASLVRVLASLWRTLDAAGDCEVLVVDNGASASSRLRAACADVSDLVHYVHEPRNGATTARHAAVRVARGELLVFIDDDVWCPDGWLSALLKPFQQSGVGIVGGRVVLEYEAAPPSWVSEYQSYLSGLDLGDKSRALSPYTAVYSCNMAVRSTTFWTVGGLNPDYYSDPAFLKYCGDGECGLARKVYDRNEVVWYEPSAWVKHIVPASRITPQYVARRAEIGGVEAVYRVWRYQGGAFRLASRALRSALRVGQLQAASAIRTPASGRDDVKRMAGLAFHRSVMRQAVRLLGSSDLRRHAKRASYL